MNPSLKTHANEERGQMRFRWKMSCGCYHADWPENLLWEYRGPRKCVPCHMLGRLTLIYVLLN